LCTSFGCMIHNTVTKLSVSLCVFVRRLIQEIGTILRLCDWFGVKQILCSKETVDIYNPKVVQATMGSIGRVSKLY
jgi:TrmH family RNA methyltransferase